MDNIRIASANCQGLFTPQKRLDVLNFYKNKNYSIICLQDTHFIPEIEPYIEAQWGFKCFFNSFRSNARGVAIMLNNNFEYEIHNEKRDSDGNFLALDITIEDNRTTIINIYGPNYDDPEFFDMVTETFTEFDNKYFILCGDFNLALNPSLDTLNYRGINNPKARVKLLEVMEDLQLLDYYRILNPDKRVYTWIKKNPLKQGRLDYILISDSLCNLVENISIKPGYRSDHSTVIMELKFSSFTRGHGLWKFNNSLLTDIVYVEKVKQIIESLDRQYFHDIQVNINNNQSQIQIDDSLFFEVLLMEIRGATISYSSFKKKQRTNLERSLLDEIENIEASAEINIELLEEKKISLENLRKDKLQGHIIRSRARWVEDGEKPTKYFCNVEARNFINKTIKRVELEGGNKVYNQEEIMNHV